MCGGAGPSQRPTYGVPEPGHGLPPWGALDPHPREMPVATTTQERPRRGHHCTGSEWRTRRVRVGSRGRTAGSRQGSWQGSWEGSWEVRGMGTRTDTAALPAWDAQGTATGLALPRPRATSVSHRPHKRKAAARFPPGSGPRSLLWAPVLPWRTCPHPSGSAPEPGLRKGAHPQAPAPPGPCRAPLPPAACHGSLGWFSGPDLWSPHKEKLRAVKPGLRAPGPSALWLRLLLPSRPGPPSRPQTVGSGRVRKGFRGMRGRPWLSLCRGPCPGRMAKETRVPGGTLAPSLRGMWHWVWLSRWAEGPTCTSGHLQGLCPRTPAQPPPGRDLGPLIPALPPGGGW